MVDLGQEFKTEEHESQYEPAPAGIYRIRVESSEMKPTKSGGKMLVFEVKIVGPTNKGKGITHRFNWSNPDGMTYAEGKDPAVIGKQQFANFCKALGRESVRNTADLHSRECNADVHLREYDKSDGTKGLSNEIKKFMPISTQPKHAAQTESTGTGTGAWGA